MTETKVTTDAEASSDTPIEMAEFLESQPPGRTVAIPSLGRYDRHGSTLWLKTPELQLHCLSEHCGEKRFFQRTSGGGTLTDKWNLSFLVYECRNCGRSFRQFAVAFRLTNQFSGEIYKFGKRPPFGPPLPSRVISLIGPDRDLFIKGRRAENQGLGIGAFAYYRRVVENQWTRLVGEIIKVAERLNAVPATIEALKAAAVETQFSRAVESVKTAIPESLRIRGHNPLTLLYKPLSEGIHEKTDEECLELASSIRIVLTELADRISQALKDEREVTDAVSTLLNRPATEEQQPDDSPRGEEKGE